MKKFYAVIGNPPYNDEAPGASTSDKPIYHFFFDESNKISDKVELITPAKFLFNAGGTPKKWNEKMLNSEHLRVLLYKSDAKDIFPTTTFTGGVAVSYMDKTKQFTPIQAYTPYPELNSIKEKVLAHSGFSSMSEIVSGRTPYSFTDEMHNDYPDAEGKLSDGHKYDVSSNSFEAVPEIYCFEDPCDERYVRVLGRKDNKRAYAWIKRQYVKGRQDEFIGTWKVFLPKANGASGMLGDEPARLISKPEIGEPNDIATDTFLCVGSFNSEYEADAAMKYLNSKFARVLLGILKVTQLNAKDTWTYVPIQDFTRNSDIDWTLSSNEIDNQLNKKYGLSNSEVEFIDNHVKEMT